MPNTLLQQGSILLVAGLDVSKPAEYISEQAASRVQNFKVDRGLLTKRKGTVVRGSVIGGTDVEIMHGREFTREGVKYNVRISRDKIESYNTGTGSWDDITNSDFTGSTDDLFDTAIPLLNGQPILCVTNGLDTIRKWTGSGDEADLGGNPPKAKFIQEFATYLVCANITGGVDNPQRVQWPDTADPEDWTGGNAGAVDLIEDGEPITGMNVFGNFLCVHKKTSIYLGALVSTSAIFRFDRKNTEVGTVANGSIVNLPTGEQIFLGIDGLHLFNGISAPLIPSPINDEIRDNLNFEKAHKAWGVLVLEEDEVWVGVPIGDQVVGETVYKYNYRTGVIYKDFRTNINTAWRASASTGLTWDDIPDEVLWDNIDGAWDDGQTGALFGEIHFGSTTGYTTVQDIAVAGDNGQSIACFWESKDFQDQEINRLCRWQELHLWVRGSGELIVEYSEDEGDTWTPMSNSPVTIPDNFSSPEKLYFDNISLKNRVRFRNDSLSDTVEIKQFMLGYTQREYV